MIGTKPITVYDRNKADFLSPRPDNALCPDGSLRPNAARGALRSLAFSGQDRLAFGLSKGRNRYVSYIPHLPSRRQCHF